MQSLSRIAAGTTARSIGSASSPLAFIGTIDRGKRQPIISHDQFGHGCGSAIAIFGKDPEVR